MFVRVEQEHVGPRFVEIVFLAVYRPSLFYHWKIIIMITD